MEGLLVLCVYTPNPKPFGMKELRGLEGFVWCIMGGIALDYDGLRSNLLRGRFAVVGIQLLHKSVEGSGCVLRLFDSTVQPRHCPLEVLVAFLQLTPLELQQACRIKFRTCSD